MARGGCGGAIIKRGDSFKYFPQRGAITASYPDVSLLMKMCAQRKAGSGPLRFITSHSFRARLCHAKNEAPEEEAGAII